jgi:hypothetical protein
MSIRNIAAILAMAAFVAADKHTTDAAAATPEAEEQAFIDAFNQQTLTGVMVDYSMNGYDWPLTCKTGVEQSPVNLHSGFASTNTALAIRAKDFATISTGTMNKRASNMALDLPRGQFDIIDPMGGYTEYTPYEAVIKSPSEHTVDGLTYDAEL